MDFLANYYMILTLSPFLTIGWQEVEVVLVGSVVNAMVKTVVSNPTLWKILLVWATIVLMVMFIVMIMFLTMIMIMVLPKVVAMGKVIFQEQVEDVGIL